MNALVAEDAVELPIANSGRLYAFDGTRPHETGPYGGNISSRLSIMYFQSARGWQAPPATIDGLSNLGFVPAVTEADAQDFANRFEVLSCGCSYTSWKLRQHHSKADSGLENLD